MIFNLPEGKNGNSKDVQNIIDHLTDHSSPAFECFRVGKSYPDKMLPLRVIFATEASQNTVLRNSHKLQSLKKKPPQLGIAPDRTRQQQEEYQDLRAELQARRDNGKHVLIVNNRIVRDKRPIMSDAYAKLPGSGSDDIQLVVLPNSQCDSDAISVDDDLNV